MERVTPLTLLAASDRLSSRLLKRSWLSSPSSWLMRRVASSTLLRMVMPWSASTLSGEDFINSRGMPPGPSGRAAMGSVTSSSLMCAIPVTPW